MHDELEPSMASQPHILSGKTDAAVSEHDWTSPLLPDHGDAPSSYVEPNRPPAACQEKSTSLSMETKALAKSSVGLPRVLIQCNPIELITGTLGLSLPASVLHDTLFIGKPSPPAQLWR